jgi:hypothetical protein
MSLENAKANLKEFGKELNLEGLSFDENFTCILGIDNTFSLHLTYEPNSDRLYLYSPILDGLPKDDKIKLKLYESLLEDSMLGGKMAGGGVGVAVKEELILMHTVLEMGSGADTSALRSALKIGEKELLRFLKEETMVLQKILLRSTKDPHLNQVISLLRFNFFNIQRANLKSWPFFMPIFFQVLQALKQP